MNKPETLLVEHPELTVGELCEMIENQNEPVRRSTHVGNQPPCELVIMTALPPGIEVTTVDTIRGNDNYSKPHDVVLDGGSLPLCERSGSKGMLVGSIAVSKVGDPKQADPRVNELVVAPRIGESLASFHTRALEALNPTNTPTPMSDFFAREPEILTAAMQAVESTRAATATGHIINQGISIAEVGVFGIDDITPTTEGAMPSLDVMLAMDVLLSIAQDAERTVHLGSVDMVKYTRDTQRMQTVAQLITKVCMELGMKIRPHRYDIVDITGLGNIVSTATHASQHQLLRVGHALHIDLERLADQPCGRSEAATA
jgi:hypothetical protein